MGPRGWPWPEEDWKMTLSDPRTKQVVLSPGWPMMTSGSVPSLHSFILTIHLNEKQGFLDQIANMKIGSGAYIKLW